MRGLADSRVIHVQIGADRPDDHLPRVQPDADLDRDAVRTKHAVAVPFHALLHPQRRIAGAHCVVLVRERRAEEGHDPIAHHLVHRALVAVDGLHHVLEDGIEKVARVLGIAVG